MLAPQSDEEVRAVVARLQRLDPLLDIIWNPTAKLTKHSQYSVLGTLTPAEYEGRWQIIRHQTQGLHDREHTVIATVTQPYRYGRRQILIMESSGPYAPVGDWILEYMEVSDAAGRAHVDTELERDRANEAVEQGAIDTLVNDRAAHQEGLEKVYAEQGGGEYWMGRGFGKGKKTNATTGAPS